MTEAKTYKYRHTPCETCETGGFNRMGICAMCGFVGAYDLGPYFRCISCIAGREPELFVAAREVVTASYLDDSASRLKRLSAAVEDYKGTTLYMRGGDQWQKESQKRGK